MRQVLFYFNDYRQAAWPQIEENRALRLKLRDAEFAFASKSPVNEAEFAFDERTPLSLYDCLIPKLTEHRKFKWMPDTQLIPDYQAKENALVLEKEIQMLQLPQLRDENET